MTAATVSPPVAQQVLSHAERVRRKELDEALVLELASAGVWRICDGRVPQGPRRLLALVAVKAGEFEVMQLADQFTWAIFPTMRDALIHVVVTHEAVLAVRTASDSPWLR